MMRMPPLCMGHGDPAEHLGEFAIVAGPEQEMPVIGHQAVGGNADAGCCVGFGENVLKGGVVSGLLEQRKAPDTTVQDVIGKVSRSKTWTTGHVVFYRIG